MEVAGAPTRIARCWCQSGVAGEVIRGGEVVQAAADAGQELGAQQCPDADHAGDHRSVLVRLEAFSDHGVELGELAIEVKYVGRESGDGLVQRLLARDLGALRLGSVGGLRRRVWRQDGPCARVATTPRSSSLIVVSAVGVWKWLIKTSGPRLVKSRARFQRWEDAQQVGAQPVDRAGAVGGDVGSVCGQRPESAMDRLAQTQFTKIVAHAGLVGDDRGVLRVGLALASVGRLRHG